MKRPRATDGLRTGDLLRAPLGGGGGMAKTADTYIGPWFIERKAALWIGAALQARDATAPAVARKMAAARPPFTLVGTSVALVPVFGVLVPSASVSGQWWGDETSHDQLRAGLWAAVADPDVQSILLSFDSPGGVAAGLSGLVDDVRAAAARKPLFAFTESQMASAAYMLAAQARRIYVSAEAAVGSIGSLIVFVDWSAALAAAGIKVDVIATGPLKGTGTEGTSLTADQRAELQNWVDQTAAVFKAAVARGRGWTAVQVECVATGGMWIGQQAVAAGLADEVATLSQVVAKIGTGGPSEARTVRAADHAADATLTERQFAQNIVEAYRMSRIFGGPVGPSSPIASGVGAGAGPAIHSHDRDADCNVATLSAALALRLGRTVVNARASAEVRAAQTRAAEVGSRFAGMSALDICHEALRLEGRPLHRGAESVVRNALSTNSLGNVFANVAHLSLEQGFDEEADSTDGWCAETDRPNFLDYTGLHVKLGDGLKLMGRGQLEPELSSLEDTGSTGQIRRYGEQFIISEQDILDDRLGVIMDAILRRGSAGKRLRVLLVYATLLSKVNDTTLFHADNGNYGTSGSALSISALRTAKAAMSKQKENGETLNLVPRYLVTGAELEFLASQLVGSAELQQVLAVVAEQVGTKNPIASWGLQHRSDARLDNGFKHPRTGATIAGSSTRWMLFAGAQAPVVEVAYRSGTNRRPRILTFNLTEGKRGWGATVDHDLGVRICGYQGAYYATGDA